MIRFVLHPGPVVSRTDGDVHRIGAHQLARLYHINPHEAVVYEEGQRYPEGVIHLGPDSSGRYELPTR